MQSDYDVMTPEIRSGFSLAGRAESFGYAASGLRLLIRREHNAWIHQVATVLGSGVSLYLDIDLADWRWIIASIAAVWAAEAFNTAIEQVCDLVCPRFDPRVQMAKDLGAGAVLAAAIGAALVGIFTLLPYVPPTVSL